MLGQENQDRNLYDFMGRTNGSGEADFMGLVPGTWFYEVEGEGPTGLFALIDGSAEVTGGEVTRVTVTGGRPAL